MQIDVMKTDGLSEKDFMRIIGSFAIHGEVKFIKKIKKGYINRTYEVDTLSQNGNIHKYILQRINTEVFKDVNGLMSNFLLVTEHLKDIYHLPGGESQLSVLSLRLTKDGRTYLKDRTGCWRMVKCFDNVYSIDVIDNPVILRNAGEAFGLFVKLMADVPVEEIVETIPNFHNTAGRCDDLMKAVKRDKYGRAKEVTAEVEKIKERIECFKVISMALESGEIPTRICHNDCNLNNILFDKETNLPVAIIDLDTVMPSSPLYDFGDSIRSGTCTSKDDEKDLSKVNFDINLFEQYAKGFLKSCGSMLTKRELELLPYASIIITSEDGIRFLTDYLNGDTYYKTEYKGQNLDRARNQLHLAEDMIEKLDDMKTILNGIYEEMGLKA